MMWDLAQVLQLKSASVVSCHGLCGNPVKMKVVLGVCLGQSIPESLLSGVLSFHSFPGRKPLDFPN